MVQKMDQFVDQVDGKNSKLAQQLDQQNERIAQFMGKVEEISDKFDEKLDGLANRLSRLEEASEVEMGIAENSTLELNYLQTQVKRFISDKAKSR